MQESSVVLEENTALQSEEEAYELFCKQIECGLKSIREGRVFSIEEAWKEIDRI